MEKGQYTLSFKGKQRGSQKTSCPDHFSTGRHGGAAHRSRAGGVRPRRCQPCGAVGECCRGSVQWSVTLWSSGVCVFCSQASWKSHCLRPCQRSLFSSWKNLLQRFLECGFPGVDLPSGVRTMSGCRPLNSQTRPVWDCHRTAAPQRPLCWHHPWPFLGSPTWQSQTGRVWDNQPTLGPSETRHGHGRCVILLGGSLI